MAETFEVSLHGEQWTEEEMAQIKAGKTPVINFELGPRQAHDIDLPSSEYHRLNFGKLD